MKGFQIHIKVLPNEEALDEGTIEEYIKSLINEGKVLEVKEVYVNEIDY